MLSNLEYLHEHLGRIGLCALLALALPSAHAADREALDMGVFPYLSTRTLLDLYQPVRAWDGCVDARWYPSGPEDRLV